MKVPRFFVFKFHLKFYRKNDMLLCEIVSEDTTKEKEGYFMEIELKYAIENEEVAQRIWEDERLRKMEEPNTRETVFMKGTYFDTDTLDLSTNDIAYRIRSEGDKLIASLKWGGQTEGPLHTREEINVPVNSRKPNPVTFEESDIGKDLIRILNGKQLKSIMEVNVQRHRFRIDTQKSILEISLDEGEIVTDYGVSPICEVEIELFSGDQEDLMEMGRSLEEAYGVVSEKRSKYYRGLMLARKKGR